MVKFALVLLTFSSSVFSQNIDFVIDALDYINNAYDASNATCEELENKTNVTQQCMHELCGTTRPLIGIDDINSKIGQYADDSSNVAFLKQQPKLRKDIERYRLENLRLLNNLKQKLKGDITLEDITSIEDVSQKIFDPYVIKVIDSSAPFNRRFVFRPRLNDNMTREVAAGIEDYVRDLNYRYNNDPRYGMDLGYLSRRDQYAICKSYKKLIKDRIDEYSKTNKLDSDFDPKDYLSVNCNARNLSIDDVSSVVSSYIDDISLLGKGEDDPGIDVSLCKSDACKQGVASVLKSKTMLRKLNRTIEVFNDPHFVEDRLSSCRSSYIAQGMNARKLNSIAKNLPIVLKGIEKNVLTKFSKESSKSFLSFVNNKLQFQNDHKPIFASYKDLTDQLMRESKSSIIETDDHDDWKIGDYVADYYDRYFDKSDLELTPFASCVAASSSIAAGDYFQYHRDNNRNPVLSSSVMTNIFEQSGQQFIAHELGHAFFYHFAQKRLSTESGKKLINMYQCLEENNGGSKQYTHEDFADLFSSVAMKDNPVLNYCALVPVDYKGRYNVPDTLANTDLNDSHSSPQLRVIREANAKGHVLPLSCQILVQEAQGVMGVKSCMQK